MNGFWRHFLFGPDVEKCEEFVDEHSRKCEEIRRYWETGSRPVETRCSYDSDGNMIWNEVTGICGPASYIP